MCVGHIGSSLCIEIDIVRAGLVIRTERAHERQCFRIQQDDPVIAEIGDKQVLAVGRQFQIMRIIKRRVTGRLKNDGQIICQRRGANEK